MKRGQRNPEKTSPSGQPNMNNSEEANLTYVKALPRRGGHGGVSLLFFSMVGVFGFGVNIILVSLEHGFLVFSTRGEGSGKKIG